jgi:uncharacterized protein (DUF2141 family)
MSFDKAIPLITATLLALGAQQVVASELGSVTIEMQGIHYNDGQAIFILMDSEPSHRGDAPIFIRKLEPVNQHGAQVTIADVPTGDYSAVIYHDLNANGKLDRNFFGKPIEPYGFSNNARNLFGIPDFDDSKFSVNARHTIQTIVVK